MKLLTKTTTGIAAGLLGVAIGAAATGSATPTTAAPAPAKTVTVPAPAETVERTVTPAACTTALEDADRVIGISGDALGAAADGYGAIARGDIAGVTEANEKISAATPKMHEAVDAYKASRAECRNGGV